MHSPIIALYTILHFLVDFACAVLLYFQASPFLHTYNDIFYAFLLYNFFAFAIQLPIGILADYMNKNALITGTGFLLVVLAYLCAPLGLTACIIAGIGNACFHIGAGIDIINLSDKKATPSGIFVSSGALGIFLGAQPFMNTPTAPIMFMLLLSLGGYISYPIIQYNRKTQPISIRNLYDYLPMRYSITSQLYRFRFGF